MATILLVDDSASLRKMVSAVLKETGNGVVEAVNGQEALSKAEGQQFDLVISDVNMPVMDGITLVKELRGLTNYKLIPILMLTTEGSKNIKQQGKAAGATGWISKPFNPQKLRETVNKALS